MRLKRKWKGNRIEIKKIIDVWTPPYSSPYKGEDSYIPPPLAKGRGRVGS
ncbi:MAG: hypothetical protein LBU14_05565 [Candidatus Peribacteria bacterium]|nr:hypothetical protein [Candidatus Peribacteria bacterium]